MQGKRQKKQCLMVWIVAICFGAAYLLLCFNHNVWTDEAFTFWLIRNDYAGIIQGTAWNVHPPLYYLIAKTAAMLFPTYEYRLLVQKIVSIIPTVLTLGIGGTWLLKRNFGAVSAAVFQVTMGLLPCTMIYAVQIRMYAWGLLFITLCGVAAYDAYVYGRMRDWILFILMGLAASYTHNYAFASALVICGLLFLCVVIKKRERFVPWLVSVTVMALGYLPWFRILLGQISRTMAKDIWIEPITGRTIWGYFEWAFDNGVIHSTVMMLCLFLTAGIGNITAIVKERRKEDVFALLCWTVPFFTALGGVVISLLNKPIYYNRYVYPAMGLLGLFFAIALRKARKPFFLTLMLFLLCYGAGSYRQTYHDEYYSSYIVQTEAFFDEHLGPNDVVVYNWSVYGMIYGYYFEEGRLFSMYDMDLGGEYDNIWFLFTAHCGMYSEEVMEAYGLTSEYMGHMGIEMNEFDVYRIYREEGSR